MRGCRKDAVPLLYVQEGLYPAASRNGFSHSSGFHVALATSELKWCVSKAYVIKVLYGVRKCMLCIRFLAVLVFIGLLVFNFDELECLRSSCYNRWRIHFSPLTVLLYKLYSTNLAFHFSLEGFLNLETLCQN